MAMVLLIALGLAALKIADLSAHIKHMEENASHTNDTLAAIIGKLYEPQTFAHVLDLPDGFVTDVNDERQEVLINFARGQGARPHWRMSIFDPTVLHAPAAGEKGVIELIRVDDQFSTARIIKTTNPTKPVRAGDIVYSPIWSINGPARFALIGKIDANRDDEDDRDELKRMIIKAGGVIDFDLPPSDVGQETGTLSPRIDWYVTDGRTRGQGRLMMEMGDAIRQARLDGIRPMPIERLLPYLSYDDNQPAARRPQTSDLDRTRRASVTR
jgi:hypothetical protein